MKAIISAMIVVLVLTILGYTLPAMAGNFPSFHPDYPPPDDWEGPVFGLIDDYPDELSMSDKLPWSNIPLKQRPFAYANAVLSYALEGNLDNTGAWRPKQNTIRRWYHAPWMHLGCGGREFTHGLTRERSSRPGELHPNLQYWRETWAISLYNALGAWTLGQVWMKADNPNPKNANFPEGTVAVKLLFTAATDNEVPYLDKSLTWDAHVYPNFDENPCSREIENRPREIRKLRLLQFDLAVRDSQADETGWVFATFMYDASVSSPRAWAWDRMTLVGVSWGNDPSVEKDMNTPNVFVNPNLMENVLNKDLLNGPNGNRAFLTHAGLGGRLNGPLDNPLSSCMSCHGRAASPSMASTPFVRPGKYTADELKIYFANINPGATEFLEGKTSHIRLDYSLQLAFGIRSFCESEKDKNAEVCVSRTLTPLSNENILSNRQFTNQNFGPPVTRGEDGER